MRGDHTREVFALLGNRTPCMTEIYAEALRDYLPNGGT